MSQLASDPVLDCAAAGAFEKTKFEGDESREWAAMKQAGAALTQALWQDLAVAGVFPTAPGRVLVLVGKGHNGGDAMQAAAGLLQAAPDWQIEVGFVSGQSTLRPLALAAWQWLQGVAGMERAQPVTLGQIADSYTLVIDGVFGFQFRAPLREPAVGWLTRVNAIAAGLRAAVDLPSGCDDAAAFVADVTYATGIVKSPLLSLPNAGRLRYLDLKFFAGDESGDDRVVTHRVLDPLRELRPAHCDKRSFGHLLIVGGSRLYPGAVAMSAAAALQSGVGLVTALVPESLAAAYAARWPEVMWCGCPETPDGNIAMESGMLLASRMERATALLIGPGLGREAETMTFVADTIERARVPLVLDADALQHDLVARGRAPRVLTPHQGEFDRILRGREQSVHDFDLGPPTVLVLKGPITRIVHERVVYHSLHGGPVLARGGSGDLLAGLIGGRLAANPSTPLVAAAQGVVWHGLAAERLAMRTGETATRVTALIEELAPVLRGAA